MPCIFTALYRVWSRVLILWFYLFGVLIASCIWLAFLFILRKIFSYSSSGEGVFSAPLELNLPSSSSMPAIQSLGFSVRCFFLVVPAGTFSLLSLCLCLIDPFSSPSLQAHIVCPLLGFLDWWDFPQSLFTWVFEFENGSHQTFLSLYCTPLSSLVLLSLLHSIACVLGQQLLSVWIAFTNLDALCFLSTHVFDSFNHSFDFSGISPNSFSLDTISVGFIKWLKELRYLVFMCGFCYSSGTYTTAVNIFAWFTLLLMIRSQLTYLM